MALLGKRVTTQDRPEEVERLPRTFRGNPTFVLHAHPTRWQLMPPVEEGAPAEWLPLLGKLPMDPGVGGVGADHSGRVDAMLAKASLTERQFTVIEPSDQRLPEAFRDYVVRYENEARHPVHVECFVSFEMVGNRVFSTTDKKGYRRFLRSLVTEGLIPPIHHRVRKALEAEVRGTHSRSEDRAATANSPRARGRAAMYGKRVDWLETATTPERGGDWTTPSPKAPEKAGKKAA